ncbi:MAG: hypothetical protein KGL39_41050 [Patescibacteria group bacterium]|nr:hypothetical protein [Patescibacteria group bacterium]
MRALFVSRNLLGDGLWIGPAIAAWSAVHPEVTEKVILTNDDYIKVIYSRMGISDVRVTTDGAEERQEWDFRYDMNPSVAMGISEVHKCHIAEAYAEMLGVELAGGRDALCPTFYCTPEDEAGVQDVPMGALAIAPFSRSCASLVGLPANKMLPWPVWQRLLTMLRAYEVPVVVLGGAKDRATELGMFEQEYICGWPLPRLAYAMATRMRGVIGVDNGVMHLAASQRLPELLFYPACLGQHWIVPWGNPNLMIVHLDPVKVAVDQLFMIVRKALPRLFEKRAEWFGEADNGR